MLHKLFQCTINILYANRNKKWRICKLFNNNKKTKNKAKPKKLLIKKSRVSIVNHDTFNSGCATAFVY